MLVPDRSKVQGPLFPIVPNSFVYYLKYFCIREFRLSDSLSLSVNEPQHHHGLPTSVHIWSDSHDPDPNTMILINTYLDFFRH